LPAGAAPLPPGDADLITASRGGDATAYDTLYRRSLMAGGTLGLDSTVHASPDGWTCVPDAAGARCTHGPLAAATSTASYLLVAVAPGAPAGGRPPAARFAAPGWYAGLTAPARIRCGLWAAVPTAFSKYCIRMRPKLQQSRT